MTPAPRWRWLRRAAVLLIAALIVMVVIGLANAQSVPIMRETTLQMPGLASGSRATKIALLSDIHLGNLGMRPGRLSAIIDQVNAAHPDLILIAGDFVTGHDAYGAAERAAGLTGPLGRLRAPLGVVAVLGNHDHWTDPAAIRVALVKANVVVLENRALRRGPFAIIGIGDRFSGHDNVAASLSAGREIGGIPVVLSHSPDLVPDLPPELPLVLAGHTHCGQIVLPGFGWLAPRAPSDRWRPLYNPRYRCGIVHDGARATIVTAGVGSGTAAVRLGAMPDWWLITLRP
jgi:predicted MPP superfamily phosphohydrolase